MLDLIDIYFDYMDKPLLQGITFQVHSGTILHLKGDNGAGKTTLLRLLAGFLQPTQGQIYYKNNLISHNRAAYQQQICYVGHKSGVSPWLTVREHCCYELHDAISEWPDAFSLKGLEDTPCYLLSAGQRRRLSLMRLLASKATLWLLDEPLVGLDKPSVTYLMQLLEQHARQGGQVVLTSHQALSLSSVCEDYCL